jgi:beta-lactam-binding protein with PASTA domain
MKFRIPRSVTRFFNIVLGSMAMLIVALVSAFITMRLAIHGHEVKVPNLTNLTLSDASHKASSLGLNLNLENRFYSHTPAGRVLAQSPPPGSTVRREWAIRITESLGPQQVAIPTLIGQTERTSSINVRRLGLELGTVAQIPFEGDPGLVIAQTPNANAGAIDRPFVSLLLSAPEDAASKPAFVMPSLAGLTLASAAARAAAIGLHIASAEDLNLSSTTSTTSPTTATPPKFAPPALASAQSTTQDVTIPATVGTVVAQTPSAGHRVTKGDAVHITLTD